MRDPTFPVSGPTRVLWLTKGLGRGGVERLLVDMLPLIDSDRYQVEVAYVLPWKNDYHEAIEEAGTRVYCLGDTRSGDPRWIGRLGRLLAAGRHDIVHSHAPIPGVAARLVTLGRARPVLVHTEHNMWDRYRWPTRWFNSVTYSRNRHAMAVSDTVARSISPLRSSRAPEVTTIHHGTVLDSICSFERHERLERRRSLGLPDDRFLIGNVGNFTPKKDHHNLLQALAGDGSISKAHLVLIGLGPLEVELREAAEQLGVADRTTFLGSRDDVFELLPLLDAFCLSSRFEGFPIALVEAMATGLPVVATDVGGIVEIVDDGENGLLVPSQDPQRLRAALERFMEAPDVAARCGAKAKVSAEALDLRHAVSRTEDIYHGVLAGAGR